MNWELKYLPKAEKDLKDLDGTQRILVLKAIKKVQQNPLPTDENGYGKQPWKKAVQYVCPIKNTS